MRNKLLTVDVNPLNSDNLNEGVKLSVAYYDEHDKLVKRSIEIPYPIENPDLVNELFREHLLTDDCNIRIARNGSLVIDSLPNQFDVSLKSFSDIVSVPQFEAELASLSLEGNTIALNGRVNSNDDISLNFKNKFENFSEIKSRKKINFNSKNGDIINHQEIYSKGGINFFGLSKLDNKGIMQSFRDWSGVLHSVKNEGAMLGRQMMLKLEACPSDPESAARFSNYGLIHVDYDFGILSKSHLHNYGKMWIRRNVGWVENSKSKIMKELEVSSFRNFDEFRVGGAVNLKTQNECVNGKEALLSVDESSVWTFKKFTNDGDIFFGGNANFVRENPYQKDESRETLWVNSASGVIQALKQMNIYTHQFANAGQILSESLIKLVMGSKVLPVNLANGVIHGINIILQNQESFLNYGEITGIESLVAMLGDQLKNLDTASLNSEELIKILCVHKLLNEGDIFSGKDIEFSGDKARQGEEGRTHAERNLDMNVRSVKLKGETSVGERATFHVSKFKEGKGAMVEAGKELELKAREKIKIKSHLESGQKLFLQTYGGLLQTEASLIRSEIVEISASELLQKGSIEAKKSILLKALISLAQSETAKTFAESIKINSSGSLIASGEYEAQEKILLESIGNLVVQQGAELFCEENIELLSKSQASIEGKLTANQEIFLDVVQALSVQAEALVQSKRVHLKSSDFANAGEVNAESLNVNTDHILKNLLTGILVAGSEFTLKAGDLENAGHIKSFGIMQAKIAVALENLTTGTFEVDDEFLLTVGGVLKNAGIIHGYDEVLLKVGSDLENLANAEIFSEGRLVVDVMGGVRNWGGISGDSTLSMKIGGLLQQFQSGRIEAQEALDIIAADLLNTNGSIKGNDNLSIQVKGVLDNQGEITAEQQLSLIAANLIRNSSILKSEKSNLIAKAGVAFKNLDLAKMTAENKIKIFAEFMQEHGGHLQASHIDLESRLLIESFENAKCDAKKSETIQAPTVRLSGEYAAKDLGIKADLAVTPGNFSASNIAVLARNQLQHSGKYKAEKELELKTHQGKSTGVMEGETILITDHPDAEKNTKSNFSNAGEVSGDRIIVDHDSLINSKSIKAKFIDLRIRDLLWNARNGKIESLKELNNIQKTDLILNEGTLFATEVLRLYASTFNLEGGELKAAKSAMIMAMDMLLKGDIATCEKICLVVSNNFSYETATLGKNSTLEVISSDKKSIFNTIKTDGKLSFTLLPENWSWFHEQAASGHHFSCNRENYFSKIHRYIQDQAEHFNALLILHEKNNSNPEIRQNALKQLKVLSPLWAAHSFAEKQPSVNTPIGPVLSPFYQWWQNLSEAARTELSGVLFYLQEVVGEISFTHEAVLDLESLLDKNEGLARFLLEITPRLQESCSSWKQFTQEKPYWHKSEWHFAEPPFADPAHQGDFYMQGNMLGNTEFTLNVPGHVLINNFDYKNLGILKLFGSGFKSDRELMGKKISIQATQGDIHFGKGALTAGKEGGSLQAPNGNLTFQESEAYFGNLDAKIGKTIGIEKANVQVGDANLDAKALRVDEAGILDGTGNLNGRFEDIKIGGFDNKKISDIPEYQTKRTREEMLGAKGSTDKIEQGEDFSKIGSVRFQGSTNLESNSMHVTGQLLSGDNMFLNIKKMTVEKRQYKYSRSYTNTKKTSSYCGLKKKKKKSNVTIEHADSQSGGIIKSAAKLSAASDEVLNLGAEFSGVAGVHAKATTSIRYQPKTDVSVAHSSGGKKNAWGGSSSSVYQPRFKAVQAKSTSTMGSVNLLSEGDIQLTSAQLLAKLDVSLSAKKGINMGATVYKIDLPPKHFSKGLTSGSTTSSTEYAIPTSIMSLAGKVKLFSEGKIEGDAPAIVAKDAIEMLGSEIALRSIILHHEQKTKMSGISGFSYMNMKRGEEHQSAQNPILSAQTITQRATVGDVYNQAPQIRCDVLQMLADEGDVKIEALALKHHVSMSQQSVGVEFFGSKALEASMRGDFALAAKTIAQNFLPPLAALEGMLASKDTADFVGEGIKAAYSTYKMYEALAKAGSIQKMLGEMLQPKISVKYQQTKTEINWIDYALPWIQAREIVVQAGRDAVLKGVTGENWESVYIQAKRDILIEAVQDKYEFKQESVGVSVDYSPQGGFGFGASWAKAEQDAKKFLAQNMKVAKDLTLIAGREIGIKGIFIEAKHAFLEAEKIRLETVQDESHSEQKSVSFSTSGDFSASAGYADSRWAKVQAGIQAETMEVHAEELHLKGAALLQKAQPLPITVMLPTNEQLQVHNHPIRHHLRALLAALKISYSGFLDFLQNQVPQVYQSIISANPTQSALLLQQLLNDGLLGRLIAHQSLQIVLWSANDEGNLHYLQTLGENNANRKVHLWIKPDFSKISILKFSAASVKARKIVATDVSDYDKGASVGVGYSGGMASGNFSSHNKQGVNRATISNSIELEADEISGNLNRDLPSKETTKDEKIHIRAEIPVEVIPKIFAEWEQEKVSQTPEPGKEEDGASDFRDENAEEHSEEPADESEYVKKSNPESGEKPKQSSSSNTSDSESELEKKNSQSKVGKSGFNPKAKPVRVGRKNAVNGKRAYDIDDGRYTNGEKVAEKLNLRKPTEKNETKVGKKIPEKSDSFVEKKASYKKTFFEGEEKTLWEVNVPILGMRFNPKIVDDGGEAYLKFESDKAGKFKGEFAAGRSVRAVAAEGTYSSCFGRGEYAVDFASAKAGFVAAVSNDRNFDAGLQLGAGALGPNVGGNFKTPTLTLFGFTFNLKAEANAGLGLKADAGVGFTLDKTRPRVRPYISLSFYPGAGGKVKVGPEFGFNSELLGGNYSKIWEAPQNKAVVSPINNALNELKGQPRPSGFAGFWHEMKGQVFEEVLNDRREGAGYEAMASSFSLDYE